jgi:nucleoside-triphosphatase THEP1
MLHFWIKKERRMKMSVLTMEKVQSKNLSQEKQVLLNRIDELGVELAITKQFKALFDEYLQSQKKILKASVPKQIEPLILKLEDVIDKELALTERFFYQAGFNDAIRTMNKRLL